MSYVVKIIDDDISWFDNAWNNAWNKHFNAVMAEGYPNNINSIGTSCWHREYYSKLSYINSDKCEITFKDEQEYVMFILRWS